MNSTESELNVIDDGKINSCACGNRRMVITIAMTSTNAREINSLLSINGLQCMVCISLFRK